MLYKTIVLRIAAGTRRNCTRNSARSRQLLATVNRYSKELMASHDELKEQLAQANPDSDPALIASQAMELAIQELVDRLPSESTPSDEELSLDEAVAHVRPRSPRGKKTPMPQKSLDFDSPPATAPLGAQRTAR